MKPRWSVRRKILVSFISILMILAIVTILSLIDISRSSSGFVQYRKWARETNLVSDMENTMLKVRNHVAEYLTAGDEKELEAYRRLIVEGEEILHELHDGEYSFEKSDMLLIDNVSHTFANYQKIFERVAALEKKRRELINDRLAVSGPKLTNNMQELESLATGQHALLTSRATNALLSGRLYAARFSLFRTPQEADKSKQDFTAMITALEQMSYSAPQGKLQMKVRDTLQEAKNYLSDLNQLGEVTTAQMHVSRYELLPAGDQVLKSASDFRNEIRARQDAYGPMLQAKNSSSVVTLVMLTLVGLTLSIIGVFIISRMLTRPIMQGVDFASKVAEGDFSSRLPMDRRDEFGLLGKSLNKMAENLQNIDWMKNGIAELNTLIRGEHSTEQLIRTVSTFIIKYAGGDLGAYYSAEKTGLVLSASHAFSDRKNNFSRIGLGEGLVGQAALEREILHFTTVTDDAPMLNYGVDETLPPHWIIAPVVFENELHGVLQIGSLHRMDENRVIFVKEAAAILASAVNTAKARALVEQLLMKTQQSETRLLEQQAALRMANEELAEQTDALKKSEALLQTQQEELRAANEELEEQTIALKESEARLQAQQEELRVTNEELEERSLELKEQRDTVQKANRELMSAREELEKRADDLALASKYKSEFLANMSHELRTPLNSILILSRLLGDNKDNHLTDREVEFAKTIHSSGADLLNLINSILDLSKVEAGKMELLIEELSLPSLVSDTERRFRHIAEDKHLSFAITCGETLPKQFDADQQKLLQILNNLLSNAFKFTEQGGVTLTIDRPQAEVSLRGVAYAPEQILMFKVEDSGIGIPEEKQGAVFDAFVQADGTTSRKFGGSGLGLAISRDFARLMGGDIVMTSAPGTGSIFTLMIPEKHTGESTESVRPATKSVPQQQAAPAKVQSSPQKQPPERKHVVIPDDRTSLKEGDTVLLIIEDDPNFGQILMNLAREKGFKVIIADDGESGLHCADFYRPDGILLDVGLPGMDGWHVMEKLKNNIDTRHIPVHFISASDQSMRARKMGAAGFLAKPASAEDIMGAIGGIAELNAKGAKNLLVVEDDPIQFTAIRELIGNGDVHTMSASSGKEALSLLKELPFDCMILDLGLPDMSGFELLEAIRKDKNIGWIPVIIYTGRELSTEEETILHKYTDSIIIKQANAPEKLFAETSLFLHRITRNLPGEKMQMLSFLHDREAVLHNKKILVVDDDMRNVFALANILEEKGMQVVEAGNGKEALEQLAQHSDIDLVLMDIMMPEMDGYEATREIRKQQKFAKLPIIALTAKAMKGDRAKCIAEGANDYLPKPVDTEKLYSLLRVWLS